MSYTNPSRQSGLSTKLAFIHLRRDHTGTPGYPKWLVCSGPAFGTAPLRGAFQGVRCLPRPQGDANGRSMRSVALATGGGFTFRFGLNELAGGMPETLELTTPGGASQLLNTYSSYLRGIQGGLQFTRNAKFCRPRTGGSRYSGKRGVHSQWDTGATPPSKPFGDGDEPMTTYSNVDKQGAVLLNFESSASHIEILTAPIELDPDGWGTDGTDHGIEEDCGTDETLPEALLPIIAHGIRCRTRMDVVAEGVIEVTNTWTFGNRTPADIAVTGAWRLWSPRIHVRGAAAPAFFVDDINLPVDLGAEVLGAGFYEEQGDVFEMSGVDTTRNGTPEGSTLYSGGRGLLIKQVGATNTALGIGVLSAPTATDAAGASVALTAVPTFSWADRTDLSGDEVDGAKHHFMGVAHDVSLPAQLPATIVSSYYLVGGVDAADCNDKFSVV